MQNNLSDLNNHLFAMLEQLGNDEEMTDPKKLESTLARANGMCKISSQILKTASLQVSALNTAERCGLLNDEMPALIATKDSASNKLSAEKQRQKLLEAVR